MLCDDLHIIVSGIAALTTGINFLDIQLGDIWSGFLKVSLCPISAKSTYEGLSASHSLLLALVVGIMNPTKLNEKAQSLVEKALNLFVEKAKFLKCVFFCVLVNRSKLTQKISPAEQSFLWSTRLNRSHETNSSTLGHGETTGSKKPRFDLDAFESALTNVHK